MRDRVGRKLILIGAVGLIIWLLWDMIFVTVSYIKTGIENIIQYRQYTNLSEMIFNSRLMRIIIIYIRRFYLLYFSLFLIKSGNKNNFLLKIYSLFFIGFYIEFFFSLKTNVFKIENAISGVMIITGVILLETEWFTEGYRIENYGKAILTLSSWIMLILSGSYAQRMTSSIATDFSEKGMRETSNIIGVENINIIWVIKFNVFMLCICLLLLFAGVKILKKLREDYAEKMIVNIVAIGILIILAGIYRDVMCYPEGIIRYIWQLHWFLGTFLITGGILNHIGIRLRNRRKIVDMEKF